jgi:hypothetical protein
MKTQHNATTRIVSRLSALLALLPAAILAQVPVDDDGNVFSTYEVEQDSIATGNEDIPLLSTVDLEELVGPIALYPDDLLAIVLPASAYPLQIVDAARFLEELKSDPTLKPNPEWDDSVVALLNYPEVIELLNDDIDWTWRLGEAVVAQQADVVATIEAFRDRAYAAGNLKSDDHQNVTYNDGVIEITPVSEDVIYVPYYEPDRVVVYQPRPVYYYYPRAYPVYYYPYTSAYRFSNDWFWGVTTAFQIGWYSDSLHVLHHSYYGHPYFGRQYRDSWWYRRPTISRHNIVYVGGNTDITINRYYGGDRWRPRHDRQEYVNERRFTRNRMEQRTRRQPPDGNIPSYSDNDRSQRLDARRQTVRSDTQRTRQQREPITFRQRPATQTANRRDVKTERSGDAAVRRTQRRDQDTVSRHSNISRQQDIAAVRRETDRSANRSSEYNLSRRSESRQTRQTRDAATTRRVEKSPKVARVSPAARYERRTESVPKLQTRRQEPVSRRVEKRPSAASRPAQVKRSSPVRQTQSQSSQRQSGQKQSSTRKSSNSPAKPANRRSSNID